jgi:hypothetical protein
MTDCGANNLLEASYTELGYNGGDLLDVDDQAIMDDTAAYLDRGPWLEVTRHINNINHFKVKKIFFVDNSPVIVFVNSPETDHGHLHEIFNNIWCMARPRILFLALPGELYVYDLSQSPARSPKELNPLAFVKSAAEVAVKLRNYRREQVESGDIFNIEPFHPISQRADHMLIEDLKTLRRQLSQIGMGMDDKDKITCIHALIGRSIFIRYLEDRKILTREYFDAIAARDEKWQRILDTPPELPEMQPGMNDRLYVRVLNDIDFTFALFSQLSVDFNGNMFPSDPAERKIFTIDHLRLVRDFLTGDVGEQKNLFFWAYRFDIIPIELISNIYEEFYHYKTSYTKKDKDENGTHYTSIPLVEFVLSRTLTAEVLEKSPRIIDPACGSGIFLVEAFRRIVRYESRRLNKPRLSFQELEELLKNRIAGIEMNEEAVRITAFSLYIAFLHFQESKSILAQIRQENKLAYLVYTNNKTEGKKYFDILLQCDAFAVESSRLPEDIKKRFATDCADIVIGNPPWGSISGKSKENKDRLQMMGQWFKNRNQPKPTDNETGQAFLWLSLQLVKPGGMCGLLISANIFLKNSDNHREFKKRFLSSVTVHEFVNFTLCRNIFFTEAISPFAAILFKKETPSPDAVILYQTVRTTGNVSKSKEVVSDKNDLKFFTHSDTAMSDIWKVYLFGNHRDHALISRLRLYPEFRTIIDLSASGDGFKKGNEENYAREFKKFGVLPTEKFSKYGPLPCSQFKPFPERVERFGNINCYDGVRLLIRKGMSRKELPKGQLFTRLEEARFAYNSSIYGIKLMDSNIDRYKIVLAILRSSLVRYYFLMVASRWGVWRDELLPYEILSFPIIFPGSTALEERLLHTIDRIINYMPGFMKDYGDMKRLEEELDEAVFDLYSLSQPDRELIRERCRLDIDFLYEKSDSVANSEVRLPGLNRGTLETLERMGNDRSTPGSIDDDYDLYSSLIPYLEVFQKQCTPFIESGKEFQWQVIAPLGIRMIAVIFTLIDKGSMAAADAEYPGNSNTDDLKAWQDILSQLAEDTRYPIGKRIYIDGLVKLAGPQQIIIIKRNEVRLWTRRAARDDADAMLLRALKKGYHPRTRNNE